MSAEEWRAVPGCDGIEVSDLGRVRSWRPCSGKPAPRLLAVHLETSGYPCVSLSLGRGTGEQPTHRPVHRLITWAFLGPQLDGMDVRHLDGNRSNSVLSNLAYGTKRENALDAIRHGNHNQASKTHCPSGHPYDEENTRWRPKGHRLCRICDRAAKRRKRARDKAAATAADAPVLRRT